MRFSEYAKIKDEELHEGIINAAGGVIDAGISGVGNFGKQIVRGLGNTAVGLGGTIGHGISTVFGDKDSRRDARGKLVGSLGKTARGLTQVATSPYAAIHRGIEAGRRPFSTMQSDSGSGWGEMLGVRRKKNVIRKSTKPEAPKNTRRDDDVYLLSSTIPNNVKEHINKIFLSLKQGKRVVLLQVTPKDFLVKLLTKYSVRDRDRDTDNKIKYIIKELFSYYRVNKIVMLKEQGVELNPDNIQQISKYIEYLFDYINNQETETILVPGNKAEFAGQMLLLYNIVKESNCNKNLGKRISILRKKIRAIMEFYGIIKEKQSVSV